MRPVPRRRALRLSLLGVGVLVVVVVLVAFVATVVVVRRPFPTQDGSLSLPGLAGPVTVLRDDRGVPQVYASTADDLFRVQGYVQAQDRFFQMDFRRHVTAGRLSELVGQNDAALQADKVVRTLGWRRVAQAELDQADPTTRRYLDDYARGVNDYIGNRSPSQLGLDYSVLGLAHPLAHIEPWTALDSVTWFKAMAWDLRGNYDDELGRARVYGSVKDVARVDQLWPAYPASRHAPIIPDASAVPAAPTTPTTPAATATAAGAGSGDVLAALDSVVAQGSLDSAQAAVDAVPRLAGGGEDGVGSNSWVVSGALTATGKPLLANDPHLAPSLPGIWYQMGLHCRSLSAACPFDIAGFTFAGVPGVIIGHTQRIAWGMTNLGPDVTDFYLEQLTPDGTGYLRDGRDVPLQTRQETIQVAGSAPVTITVRSTNNGPLLSDVVDTVQQAGQRAPVAKSAPARGAGYAVALRWTALTPGHDMDAVFAVDTATDFGSFRKAVQMLDVPAQNFVYADIDGNIGYQAPGRIPQRQRRPAD